MHAAFPVLLVCKYWTPSGAPSQWLGGVPSGSPLSVLAAPHLPAWLVAFCPQVRGELLRERVQQLEAQEARFAESLVSLQFQKAARTAQTLRVYTTLLSIRDLLLEELTESETLTKLACEQILGSQGLVSAGAREGRGISGVGSSHPPVGGCLPCLHCRVTGRISERTHNPEAAQLHCP